MSWDSLVKPALRATGPHVGPEALMHRAAAAPLAARDELLEGAPAG